MMGDAENYVIRNARAQLNPRGFGLPMGKSPLAAFARGKFHCLPIMIGEYFRHARD
jgi:hypothetical protein